MRRLLVRFRVLTMGRVPLVAGVAQTSLLLILVLAALPNVSAAADWRKLSDGAPFSDVQLHPVISPDGRWVVFVHDQDADEAFQVFSVPIDGSAPQPAGAAPYSLPAPPRTCRRLAHTVRSRWFRGDVRRVRALP